MQLLSYEFENRFVLKFTKAGLPVTSHEPWLAGSSDGIRSASGSVWCCSCTIQNHTSHKETLSFHSEWQRKLSKQGSGEAHLKIGQHTKIHTLFLQKVSVPYDQLGQKNMTFLLCSICMYLCVHARVCAYERHTDTECPLQFVPSYVWRQEFLTKLFG